MHFIPSHIIFLVAVATLAEVVTGWTLTQYVKLYEYAYRRGRYINLEAKVVDGVYHCVNLPSDWNDKPRSYEIDISYCVRLYNDPDCEWQHKEIRKSEVGAVNFGYLGWDNNVTSISQCCNNRNACPGLEWV